MWWAHGYLFESCLSVRFAKVASLMVKVCFCLASDKILLILWLFHAEKAETYFSLFVDMPHANSFHLVWMAFSQIQRIKLYIQWKNSTKRIEECTKTVEIIQNLMVKLCTVWRPRSKIKIALNLIWWVVYVWKRRFGAMHMCRIQYKNRQWKQIKIH